MTHECVNKAWINDSFVTHHWLIRDSSWSHTRMSWRMNASIRLELMNFDSTFLCLWLIDSFVTHRGPTHEWVVPHHQHPSHWRKNASIRLELMNFDSTFLFNDSWPKSHWLIHSYGFAMPTHSCGIVHIPLCIKLLWESHMKWVMPHMKSRKVGKFMKSRQIFAYEKYQK